MRQSFRRYVGVAATAAAFPESSPHDEAVLLLHIASEIEHALMVQYLYAAYSLGGAGITGVSHEKARAWREVILGIAKEEMGHLLTVQNILRLIGGPLHLEREDYPFRSEFYSFRFKLEPLTKDSLAKYVVAESPEQWARSAQARQIVRRAQKADNERPVLRVGLLYDRLIKLFQDRKALPDEVFLRTTEPYQASWEEWGRGYGDGERGNLGENAPEKTPNVLIMRVRDRASTVQALKRIARQGEAPDPAASLRSQAVARSHFARFLSIYEAFPSSEAPGRQVPTNPTTDPNADEDCTAITNRSSRTWAHLFNIRYRKLLYTLKHAFFVPAGSDLGGPTSRGDLISWTFGEMYNLRTIGGILVTLPRGAGNARELAGPAFEVPYTLSLPDWDSDKWRVHQDIIRASARLIKQLETMKHAPHRHRSYLQALRNRDEIELKIVDRLLEAALAQEAAS